jgi:hypothetical protein
MRNSILASVFLLLTFSVEQCVFAAEAVDLKTSGNSSPQQKFQFVTEYNQGSKKVTLKVDISGKSHLYVNNIEKNLDSQITELFSKYCANALADFKIVAVVGMMNDTTGITPGDALGQLRDSIRTVHDPAFGETKGFDFSQFIYKNKTVDVVTHTLGDRTHLYLNATRVPLGFWQDNQLWGTQHLLIRNIKMVMNYLENPEQVHLPYFHNAGKTGRLLNPAIKPQGLGINDYNGYRTNFPYRYLEKNVRTNDDDRLTHLFVDTFELGLNDMGDQILWLIHNTAIRSFDNLFDSSFYEGAIYARGNKYTVYKNDSIPGEYILDLSDEMQVRIIYDEMDREWGVPGLIFGTLPTPLDVGASIVSNKRLMDALFKHEGHKH